MFLETIGKPGHRKQQADCQATRVQSSQCGRPHCNAHHTTREAATWVGIIMHIEVACMGERFLSAGVTHDENVGQAILTRRACINCDTHHAKVGPYCARGQQEASKN